ncbi:MAG: Flp family type IVb pilin [Dermatophilaceae bacterium]
MNLGRTSLRRRDEHGATAVEYALLAGFIAAAIAGSVSLIAPVLVSIFTNVTTPFG